MFRIGLPNYINKFQYLLPNFWKVTGQEHRHGSQGGGSAMGHVPQVTERAVCS